LKEKRFPNVLQPIYVEDFLNAFWPLMSSLLNIICFNSHCLFYWLKVRRINVRFPAGARGFLLLHSVQTAFGSHPSFCSMDTGRTLSFTLKRPGREADNSPQSDVELKMVQLYLHSSISLHGMMLN
jgi:hypothetical protein